MLPHRVEQPFYMSGHRAQIVGKEEEEGRCISGMEEGRVQFAKNVTLFYGRGLGHHPVSSCGGREAMRRYELRLNTALEEQGRSLRDNGFTPNTTAMEENEKTTDDCKGQTFLTETRTRNNV